MPTVYIPSSYTEGTSTNFKYNSGGGSWWAPDQYDMIATGNASGTIYRAYLRIPAPSGITSGATIQEVLLRFRRETAAAGDTGSEPSLWDIGLMTSTPGTGVTTANFAYQIADNYSVSKGGSYSISIPPANWGTPNQTKYIVFLGYSTSSGCYGQIPVFTGSLNSSGTFTNGPYPYCRITYTEGTLRFGADGVYKQCEVYYGYGGAWVKCQPYYGISGGWQQLGG